MAADGSGSGTARNGSTAGDITAPVDAASPLDARTFAASMPDTYGDAFGDSAAEHAAIAARRAGRAAHLERWRSLDDGTSIVCVVADDRAGLLSTICRVFVANDLDVMTAQV